MITPKSIKPHSSTEMAIVWDNGESTIVPYTELRYQCRCAVCVDEWTHERKITRESVKADIRPTKVEIVGKYAIQITWSDGHSTGIYPYSLLHDVARGCSG